VDAAGNVYIADATNDRIRKVTAAGTITTLAGRSSSAGGFSGDGGPADSALLSSPAAVALDASGALFIADSGNSRVRWVANVTPSASFTASPTSGPPPRTVAFDASTSTGSIAAYAWDFGDGTTGAGRMTSHTYTTPGTFTASLTVQDDAGDSSTATHTITLSAPPAPPPPLLVSPPKLTLGGPSAQRLFGRKSLTVTASCDKPCSLSATGTIRILRSRVVLALTRATASLPAAGSTVLTLRLSKAAQRALRKLLRLGRHARATISVQATDGTGHSSGSTRTIAVRTEAGGA